VKQVFSDPSPYDADLIDRSQRGVEFVLGGADPAARSREWRTAAPSLPPSLFRKRMERSVGNCCRSSTPSCPRPSAHHYELASPLCSHLDTDIAFVTVVNVHMRLMSSSDARCCAGRATRRLRLVADRAAGGSGGRRSRGPP
jgi:hypothetical protein